MFRGACVMLPYILLGFQSIISEAYHIPIVRRTHSNEPTPTKPPNEPPTGPPTEPLIHPSATGEITLFHGTTDKDAAKKISKKGFDLAKYSASVGDFHSFGFKAAYLTDSVYSAAQFACYLSAFKGSQHSIKDQKVYVVEFTWLGDTSIEEFSNFPNPRWDEFRDYNLRHEEIKPAGYDEVMAKKMITGPMKLLIVDKFLTPSFWQYAIIGHRNPTDGKYPYSDKLKHLRVREVFCGHVQMGNQLSDKTYAEGQGSNQKFKETVEKIKKKI